MALPYCLWPSLCWGTWWEKIRACWDDSMVPQTVLALKGSWRRWIGSPWRAAEARPLILTVKHNTPDTCSRLASTKRQVACGNTAKHNVLNNFFASPGCLPDASPDVKKHWSSSRSALSFGDPQPRRSSVRRSSARRSSATRSLAQKSSARRSSATRSLAQRSSARRSSARRSSARRSIDWLSDWLTDRLTDWLYHNSLWSPFYMIIWQYRSII